MAAAKQKFQIAYRAVRAHRAAADSLIDRTTVSYDGAGDLSTEEAFIRVMGHNLDMLPSAIHCLYYRRADPLLVPVQDRIFRDTYDYI